MKKTGIESIVPETRLAQASSKETPAMDVMTSIRLGFTPSWRIWSGWHKSWGAIRKLANPKSRSVSTKSSAFAGLGRTRKSMSAVKRGWPCHATANPPTTTYSTPLALSNSINSRKSLPIRIRVDPGLEFENERYPLLGSHRKVFLDIRRLGGLKATEIPDQVFHRSILQVSLAARYDCLGSPDRKSTRLNSS